MDMQGYALLGDPELKERLRTTRRAFAEEDHGLAIQGIRRHRELRGMFDACVESMFAADAPSKDEALVCAIYARYLKRISAALKNVCTSVVVPFDRIKYSKILGEAVEPAPEEGQKGG